MYLYEEVYNLPQVNIYEGDGTVTVSHGGVEMGQGLNTKVAQTVAKELGIPMDMILVKPNDSFIAPNNVGTGGSVTSEMVCVVSIKITLNTHLDD